MFLINAKGLNISGFGLSLCYVAAIIIVAYYFDRKRSFATGISVCGSGVGKVGHRNPCGSGVGKVCHRNLCLWI